MNRDSGANKKIRNAFEVCRKAEATYRKLCEETFTPGTHVSWLINGANGKYLQFGTVTDTFYGKIRVRNNRTGKLIDVYMDSITSCNFEKWSEAGDE